MLLAQATAPTGETPPDDSSTETSFDQALNLLLDGESDAMSDFFQQSILPNLLWACIGLAFSRL